MPEKIAVSAISSAAALIRAVAAFPPGSELSVYDPFDHVTTAFLESQEPVARSKDASTARVRTNPPALLEFADSLRAKALDDFCTHLFVMKGSKALLEAFDLSHGNRDVFLNGDMPLETIRNVERALRGE